MKRNTLISSLQNPLVKQIVELQSKSRSRNKYQKFVVEGLNELRLCIASGYAMDTILFSEDNIGVGELQEMIGMDEQEGMLTPVSNAIFNKIAYRKEVKNAVGIANYKKRELKDLQLPEKAIFLVAEGIEKPGNVGAILRSADAMGAHAVLLTEPRCDKYNPNVIRSSVGCVFTLPVFTCDNKEARDFLLANGFQIYTTFMEASKASWDCDFSNNIALVVGTESTGLTDFWRQQEHQNINIPMFGKVDSLNVSVAVSLLLYEASRQMRNK